MQSAELYEKIITIMVEIKICHSIEEFQIYIKNIFNI